MSDRLMKMGGDGRKTLQQRLGLEFALNAKGHINWKAGRYICHIEGHHLLSSTRHDEIGEAMQFAYDHVCFHLIKGGCGNAVVFDTYSNQIVSVFGELQSCTVDGEDIFAVGVLPMPDEDRQEQMRFLVSSWDCQLRGHDVQLPSVWELCS